MAFTLAWSPELATGDPLIDTQHQQLFAAANALYDAHRSGKGRKEVEQTMVFLVDYTINHFVEEEMFMQTHDYPEYLAHKELHEAFKDVAQALMQKLFQDGPSDAFINEVYVAVGEWLLNHVRGEDLRIAAYIKAQTV